MARCEITNTFGRDQRGVAAVEMALVAPIIAGLILVSLNLWQAAQRRQEQGEALRVASQYYMLGGADDARARELALAAWVDKPVNADVIISRVYRCGDTEVEAGALCGAAQTPPATMVKIVASATFDGAAFQPVQIRSEMVRVR